MISIQHINTDHPLYASERALRNKVLLRPIGLPDHAWEMHDEKSWHFIALYQNKLAGCLIIVPLNEGPTRVQLMQMAVDDVFRGKGVGRKLIKETITFCKNLNVVEILCHARESAIPFYEKSGFTIYGDPFTEVGIIHRYMKKLL